MIPNIKRVGPDVPISEAIIGWNGEDGRVLIYTDAEERVIERSYRLDGDMGMICTNGAAFTKWESMSDAERVVHLLCLAVQQLAFLEDAQNRNVKPPYLCSGFSAFAFIEQTSRIPEMRAAYYKFIDFSNFEL